MVNDMPGQLIRRWIDDIVESVNEYQFKILNAIHSEEPITSPLPPPTLFFQYSMRYAKRIGNDIEIIRTGSEVVLQIWLPYESSQYYLFIATTVVKVLEVS